MTDFYALMAGARLSAPQIALLMGVNVRTVRRWRTGDSPAPLAARLVLTLIAKHGMTLTATLDVPELDDWVNAMVRGMRDDGLCAINRRLGLGYGVIAQIMDGRR